MEFPFSNHKKATEFGDFFREIIMKKKIVNNGFKILS